MTANRSGDGETIVKNHVLLWGGQLSDETGQTVVLNKEPYRRVRHRRADYLKEIYSDPAYAKILPTGVNSWTDPSNNEAYLAGKLIFTNNAGTMFAKAVFDNNPVKDDTYLMLPPKGMGPGGRVLAGGGAAKRWFVIKGAKNREAAEPADPVHALGRDPEGDVPRSPTATSTRPTSGAGTSRRSRPATPARRSPTSGGSTSTPSRRTPGGSYPGPPTPWVQSLESSNFWTDMFGEVLGGKSPADAVKSAHDRAVRVFKEFGFKGE